MEQPTQNQNPKREGLIKGLLNRFTWISWTVSIFIASCVFIFVKQVVFDFVLVNDNSMSGTLNMGDAVLVKNFLNKYQKGHIVYFNFPVKDSSGVDNLCIMRLVASPGDTFEISDQKLYVNNSALEDWDGVKHNYFIKSKGVGLDSIFRAKFNLFEGGSVSNKFDYSFSLTKKQSAALKEDSIIEKVELKMEKKGFPDINCFPAEVGFLWNMDQYGKIYIPKKNDTLALDTTSIKLYSQLITSIEKNKLEIKSDSIFIDNVLTKNYVVKQNYYFVLGDNRANAIDSRIWGFLPESCIKGRIITRVKKAKK